MTINEVVGNVFDKDEIVKIRRMAIKVVDILPEKKNDNGEIIDELLDADEYSEEGAIQIAKRAFEVLDDETLEEAGVDLEDFEEIRDKMDLVDVSAEEEYLDRDAEDIAKRFRAEQRADL